MTKPVLAVLGLLLAASVAQADGIIFAPGGRTFFRFDSPNGDYSMTFGPRGQSWQTFRDPDYSITFGPRGQFFQEFNNDSPRSQSGWDADGDED